MSFLDWVDNSGLVIWIRESTSVLAYPTIIAFHTFSLALLVGMSCGAALRVLGVAGDVPLRALDRFFGLMWAGFWISAVSGVLLLASDIRGFLANPVFYVKLASIAVGVFTVWLLRRVVFAESAQPDRRPIGVEDKVVAGAVLASWLVALTVGRVLAYDRFIQWQTAGATLILVVAALAAGATGARALRRPATR